MTVSGVTHRSYFQRDLLISTVVTFGHPETGYYREQLGTWQTLKIHPWTLIITLMGINLIVTCISIDIDELNRLTSSRCMYMNSN